MPSPRTQWLVSLIALVLVSPAFAQEPAAKKTTFDHSKLDALLKQHVVGVGYVDYLSLKQEGAADLDAYLAQLAKLDAAAYKQLPESERLALLINAYNACTLKLIIEHYPLKSIMDIPESKRWKDERWQVAGRKVSLDQLEHEWIRKEFKEPRIHFAVNCASIGCPPLRAAAYTGASLDLQLEQQAERVHNTARWCKHHVMTGNLFLTKIYEWYADDFKRDAGSVLKYVAKYVPTVKETLRESRTPKVRYVDWDWSLNDRKK